jgi:hypothetical protein
VDVERRPVQHGITRSAMPACVSAPAVAEAGDVPDEHLAGPRRCPLGSCVGGCAEWIAVTSCDSVSDNGGSSPGRRCASIVLPTPGGPVIIR